LTDPDPHILKSAAAYLREIARRPDAGRRHRKQPKIDALRQYKGEIPEAHRYAVRENYREKTSAKSPQRNNRMFSQPGGLWA
jgi:hypothetical protein